MDQECAAAIWPLTLKIKQSRGLEQNDQPIEHTFWRLKILIAVTNSSTGNISVTTPWCGLLHWDVALHLVVGLFLSWFNYLHKPVAQVYFPLTRGSISWSCGYPQPSGRHPAQYLTFDPLQNSRSRFVLRSGNKNRGIKVKVRLWPKTRRDFQFSSAWSCFRWKQVPLQRAERSLYKALVLS